MQSPSKMSNVNTELTSLMFKLMTISFKERKKERKKEKYISHLDYICLSKGFPGDSAGKESTCNVGDLGLSPGLGRCPGEGKGYPLQYSGLENSMDYVAKS